MRRAIFIAVLILLPSIGFTRTAPEPTPTPRSFCSTCLDGAHAAAMGEYWSCIEFGGDDSSCAQAASNEFACYIANACSICDPLMQCNSH